MKILFVLKQKKNVETFIATIRALVDRGHSVVLAVQERSEARDDQYREDIASPGFSVVRCPAHRTDHWAEVAWLLRSLRDCAHYQQPALKSAVKLQARTVQKLREELRVEAENQAVAGALRKVPPPQIQRLETVFALAEQQLPGDPLYEAFLRTQKPDVLLLAPLVHFGSAQADFVASARALGIPVGMLLYSWDNLSTKGCLHRPPDRMFVWNEGQRREAQTLHGFPEDRVVVVGAPRFDAFFDLRPRLSRRDFHEPLGLDPEQATLLYVCSSQLVSAGELVFVRKWLGAIRSSASERLRHCNVIVRPHPDLPLLGPADPVREMKWPALRGPKGFVSRPFEDSRAIVLRTSDRAQQGFYECIHHSAAVVGLNTSAELEAAIVGRPVYTILARDEDADGQSSTLHFHYLLEEHGGCVRAASSLDEHTAQVDAALAAPADGAALRRFVGEFLRPHGIERAVAPLLADAIERAFNEGPHPEPSPEAQAEDDGAEAGSEVTLRRVDTDRPAVMPFTMPKYGYRLQLQASDSTGDAAFRLDKSTVSWLREHVGIGDVVYDIGAGAGVYTLLAAKHHGAVVVAFEPGYAAFKDLCDNLRLNGCDGQVIPLPLALAEFDGVGELKYPTGMAGHSRHSVRPGAWQVRRASGDDGHFRQPVCAISLDQALQRHGLPAPNHLRLGNASSAEGVLAGAARVLGLDSLKTIFFTLPVTEGEAVATRLARSSWAIARHIPISRGRAHVLMSRSVVGAPPSGRERS